MIKLARDMATEIEDSGRLLVTVVANPKFQVAAQKATALKMSWLILSNINSTVGARLGALQHGSVLAEEKVLDILTVPVY